MSIESVGAAQASSALQTISNARSQPTAPAEAQRAEAARRAPAAGGTTATRAAEPRKEPGPTSLQDLERALDDVRRVVEPMARNLLFTIDEDTGRTVVKVIDSATDEVIRQIPSEEILSIAKALDKLKGLLIQQEA